MKHCIAPRCAALRCASHVGHCCCAADVGASDSTWQWGHSMGLFLVMTNDESLRLKKLTFNRMHTYVISKETELIPSQ